MDQVSWFQVRPTMSLTLIDHIGITPATSVIDIGGGSSALVDELLARGFGDVTVLDVSGTALDIARRRLADPPGVTWLSADLRAWTPTRRWGLWHDRAVFHFLTETSARAHYLRQLGSSVAPGGAFVIGTFATDGPAQCSGLPVSRYNAEALNDTITTAVPGAIIIETRDEVHITPSGVTQPFIWMAGTIA